MAVLPSLAVRSVARQLYYPTCLNGLLRPLDFHGVLLHLHHRGSACLFRGLLITSLMVDINVEIEDSTRQGVRLCGNSFLTEPAGNPAE